MRPQIALGLRELAAATLLAVVEHYNSVFGFGLSAQQKADLVEYLKSL